MPTIQDAMVRSLKGGMMDVVARQTTGDDGTTGAGNAADTGNTADTGNPVENAVGQAGDTIQEVSNTISDVKIAFSSWDNCMKADFCKWPIIAIIIVGGLIVFSIVWCIARCACCGLSCCCDCCQCFKCCGNCCGCCDAPRSEKRGKYLDEPYIPPNQGYTSNEPMRMGASSPLGAQKSSPPQYAEFDVSRKGGDDALPEMPSWEGASKSKVALEEDGLELEQLNKVPNQNSSQTNILMPGASGSAGPPSPMTPNHTQQFPAGAGSNAYGGNGMASMNNDPYAAATSQSNYNRGPSPYGQPQDQYGMAAAAVGGPGRQSPAQNPYGNGGYSQQGNVDAYGRGSPRPLDSGYQNPISPQGYGNGYGRQSPAMGGLSPAGGAGRPGPNPQVRRSPAPQGSGYDQRSYSPANGSGYGNDGYGNQQPAGYAAPQRSYTGDSQRPLVAPTPQRQYTGPPSPGGRSMGQGSGFDFSNAGYSRPTPPERQGTGDSYPGRKPYQPQQQQGW